MQVDAMFCAQDRKFMQRCLLLASRGEGKVSPNPLVGAVVVKGNRIVGEGWHEKFGAPHAEANALRKAGKLARGATLYVSLEPCSTRYKGKKTPPCVPRIIKVGISRVVIAAHDENKNVHGIELLHKAGIKTESKLLSTEAMDQNKFFFHFIRTRLPFVTLKMAQSRDGAVGIRCQPNVRISGAQFDSYVQTLRNQHDGILVGIGTVLVDNPRLTCRMKDGRNPARIIIDNELRILPAARVLHNARKETVIIATSGRRDRKNERILRNKGAHVLVCGKDRVELKKLLSQLPKFSIYSILVEGGAKTAAEFLAQGLVDRAIVSVAKKKLGRGAVASPIGSKLLQKMRRMEMGEDSVYFTASPSANLARIR